MTFSDGVIAYVGQTYDRSLSGGHWRGGEGWVEGQSDISGNADFEDLPSGKTRVQVVATGWNSSGGSVDLDDREVTIEVALDRRAAPQSTAGEKADVLAWLMTLKK